MKKNVIIVILILFFCKINAQVNKKYISRASDFAPNETAYLFGDNVKLRENFSTNSKELALLKITSEIKILEKTTETYLYNGIHWPWYKVKHQDKVGYIIGGLISLDKKSINNFTYLVSFKKEKDAYKILTRVVNSENEYLENATLFGTEHHFTLEVFDNRGIENITNMALIDYHAEACGVNGGGYYLFNEGDKLTKAVDLYQVVDGDSYWIIDEVFFPNDVGGIKNKIIYKKESGRTLDDSNRRTKTTIESCEFIWEGKLLELEDIKE